MADPGAEDHGMYVHDCASVARGPEAGGSGRVGADKGYVATEGPSDQEQLVEAVDAAMPMMNATSNQLTLLFQGEVYVFESVTPDKVQAVLLLLGGCDVPTGIAGMSLPCHQDDRGMDDILRRTNIPAKRIASLIRFREKRKERNFDKKIRYTVRKEVALRMQRRKGQFAGKANPQEGASGPSSCDPAQSSGQDDTLRESKCQNCGINEKLTPAMRRGPAGPRSLCNACGLMWANKGTLRNLSRAPKMGTQNPVNPNDDGGPIDSELGGDNKGLIVTSDNHDSALNATEIVTDGIPGDVQQGMVEDLKTNL